MRRTIARLESVLGREEPRNPCDSGKRVDPLSAAIALFCNLFEHLVNRIVGVAEDLDKLLLGIGVIVSSRASVQLAVSPGTFDSL